MELFYKLFGSWIVFFRKLVQVLGCSKISWFNILFKDRLFWLIVTTFIKTIITREFHHHHVTFTIMFRFSARLGRESLV